MIPLLSEEMTAACWSVSVWLQSAALSALSGHLVCPGRLTSHGRTLALYLASNLYYFICTRLTGKSVPICRNNKYMLHMLKIMSAT